MGSSVSISPLVEKIVPLNTKWMYSKIGIITMSICRFLPYSESRFIIYSKKPTSVLTKISNQKQEIKLVKDGTREGFSYYQNNIFYFIINSNYQS